jgi:hypothetical protein
MTLADLPVLNPSTPGKEARRAVLVAALFAVFGALYALARAAASAPPDISASTDPVFSFAFPRGWGIAQALWSGASTWPTRLAAADFGTTLAVVAVVIMAIALIVVMHPDILARQGPQYVSPARRITTVVIALVLAFVIFWSVGKIDDLLSSTWSSNVDKARRELLGFAALALIMFGAIWSFIGPKDFGRRIPLRISHGALGGLGVWAAITFATMLSREPRGFLSSSLDTFYTLLTVDAAAGNAGATAGWAVSSDVLTAAVAMAVAGALLVVTAPQSLGPGNRRGSALIAAIFGAFLAVVGFTTNVVTKERAGTVEFNVVQQLQLGTTAPSRATVVLAGKNTPASERVLRMPVIPTATRDDCMHGSVEDRSLPAATAANVQRLSSWLESQGNAVTGGTIRAASCRAALLALRWHPEEARASIFLAAHPERVGPMTWALSAPEIGSGVVPTALREIVAALGDTARFQLGAEAPRRLADLARLSGDSAAERSWRQRVIQPQPGAAPMLFDRPAFIDGTIGGRIQTASHGWRVGLISIADPSSDPMLAAPRGEGPVYSLMVSATDAADDGRFMFSGLRDGYYMLALLGPDGTSPASMRGLTVRGDPGVFRLEPGRKAKDLGTIQVTY